MIKTEKGVVKISAETEEELLTDVAILLKSAREVLLKENSEEEVEEKLNKCFELSKMDHEELLVAFTKVLAGFFEAFGGSEV